MMSTISWEQKKGGGKNWGRNGGNQIKSDLLLSWQWLHKWPACHFVMWDIFGVAAWHHHILEDSSGESTLLWGVDAFVLLGCVTRCLWAAPGKTRASVGPTALDLGMGDAAALTLVGVNDSHVKAGTSVVGGEVTRWRLELYNCHWATLPSNLGKWVPRDRQGHMHMWGWAYIASGTKGTTYPLKLVMICGVVLHPCGNNLLPNYLPCSDCSTIWLSLPVAVILLGNAK